MDILKAPSETEAFPHVLSRQNGIFPNHKHIIVLGIKEQDTQSQDILILGVYDQGSNKERDAIMVEMLSLKQTAINKKFNVQTGWGSEELVQMLYSRHNELKDANKNKRNSTKIQQVFNNLLADARSKNASDIHIEVRVNEAVVRYRINGELVDITAWSNTFAYRFAQVVYSVNAEEVDVTFKPDQPQDGVIDRLIGGERLRVRLATIPATPTGCFDVIMRILSLGGSNNNDQSIAVELKELGYNAQQSKAIHAGVAKPVGATIIAGTTGSGKSTTLKNLLLSKINQHGGAIKVITVEDPPEYHIPGATQVPVVRNKNMQHTNPFGTAIRGAMRADPDILMVGEVRDEITSELLVSAVQSGHQVLSTVHAPSAISIIERLVNMGVTRDTLGAPDFIACFIYQGLLPLLCPHCKVSIEEVLKDAGRHGGFDSDMKLRIEKVTDIKNDDIYFRGAGCDNCHHGIIGRTVVAEVLLPDNKILKLVHDGKDIEAQEHWRRHGGRPILAHGIEKMKAGLVSPVDVESRLGPLTHLLVMEDGILDIDSELEIAGPSEDIASKQRRIDKSELIDGQVVNNVFDEEDHLEASKEWLSHFDKDTEHQAENDMNLRHLDFQPASEELVEMEAFVNESQLNEPINHNEEDQSSSGKPAANIKLEELDFLDD
ncbi:ATPase, T2SS/T4P/T4SS family (plasmid) [Methylomarinum sp. Ch1-1]|uniref:ATPase, T2SS/T4P/T4SS family n=1 Tax=Methylomarinum roseum TaxID=3067653 RepID=A0AAU7P0S7_9GAMM|nr:ATPase, T2SS/T4P/T4SS family [Methylomarinum sp. Ch1-1]MDP4523209.1 ATPase, T2SS/T4P/T4SS family [Methylomarinum sp. Ch1-1]